MNQDLDSRILPNGEYREAINLSISRSEGSTVGEFENILGNEKIFQTDSSAVIIGKHVDQTNNRVFIFATDNTASSVYNKNANNYIYEISLSGVYTKKVLVKGAFLNFSQSFPITGTNLIEDLLFFTDNLNQPRKINIDLANPTSAANPTHYTSEDQISVAKYAPCEPLIAIDRIVTKVNGTGFTGVTTIAIDSSAGIKPGDAVFPLNTITVPTGFDNRIYVVAVDPGKTVGTPAGTPNTVTLSSAVTVADNLDLSFTRSTATNKTNELNSNGAIVGAAYITPAPTGINQVYEVNLPASNFEASVIPKIGDIVTLKNPAGTTSYFFEGTTIVSAVATAMTADQCSWELKLSNAVNNTGSAVPAGQVLKLSVNPDYDPLWSQADSDSNFLEDKFIRFSYRFKFEDNEYSLMAPFTQPIYIPKQLGHFGGGTASLTNDMDDAYKSTIVAWFENNVQNILLKIPLPYNTLQNNINNLLINEVDILYKESDALAVKVLSSLNISNLPNPTTTLEFIKWADPVHGITDTYYYPYNYASSKPYKTLPNRDTVRVYDKVPVKALSQEVIGNRVVYGNYIDKHSSPAGLNYSALVKDRDGYSVNTVEYPTHTLKQNRTYQVGFILADRYGRSSNVVLSNYDDVSTDGGSTVYAPYKTYSQQIDGSKVIDWLGDALSVKLDTAIPASPGPGIYNGDATSDDYNPLGWYSYKVVVKQQEQEYYNVYLPGFVDGFPIVNSTEKSKTAFSTLLSDNINKVPRDLNEVGPGDREFSSSENLFIRVNNPSINVKSNALARPYNYPQKFSGWNKQYYPGLLRQNISTISTVRDFEISAIPFVSLAAEGEYGAVTTAATTSTGTTTTTQSFVGSIPWGQSPKTAPFYESDSNPFILQINTAQNGREWKPSPTFPTTPGTVGAVTSDKDAATATVYVSMQPFLTVAETTPFASALELFYESSLQGKVITLNSLINAQYSGIVAIDGAVAADFPESIGNNAIIDSSIIWKDGSGTNITDPALLTSATILSAYRANDVSQSNNVASLFSLSKAPGVVATYQLKTNSYFWFQQTSGADPSSDVYNITFQTTYTPATETFVDETTYTATLTNVSPSFTTPGSCPLALTGIIESTSTIYSFAAVNGSNASSGNSTSELVFSLDSSNTAAVLSGFSITSAGVLTPNTGTLVNLSVWSIIVKVTDANGTGASATCTINFNVGTDPVPETICAGRQGAGTAECGENIEYQFFEFGTVEQVSGSYSGTPFSTAYPPDNIYNAKFRSTFTPKTTGALTQGKMFMKPKLQREITLSDDIFVNYLVQYRATSSSGWSTAELADGSTFGGSTGFETITVTPSGSATVEDNWEFNTPGEYRLIASKLAGPNCGGSTNAGLFSVNFGDAVYGTGTGSSCYSP